MLKLRRPSQLRNTVYTNDAVVGYGLRRRVTVSLQYNGIGMYIELKATVFHDDKPQHERRPNVICGKQRRASLYRKCFIV